MMARMNFFKDIVMPVVMVPVSAFVILAAVIAVIMSLERTLGRPIPKLRESLPVRRNRGYIGVLICMALSFYIALAGILQKPWCYDGCPSPYSWSNVVAILEFSIIALAVSASIGWIVFATLSITSASWRIISRYISN
jgi:hypothetical protein